MARSGLSSAFDRIRRLQLNTDRCAGGPCSRLWFYRQHYEKKTTLSKQKTFVNRTARTSLLVSTKRFCLLEQFLIFIFKKKQKNKTLLIIYLTSRGPNSR